MPFSITIKSGMILTVVRHTWFFSLGRSDGASPRTSSSRASRAWGARVVHGQVGRHSCRPDVFLVDSQDHRLVELQQVLTCQFLYQVGGHQSEQKTWEIYEICQTNNVVPFHRMLERASNISPLFWSSKSHCQAFLNKIQKTQLILLNTFAKPRNAWN